MLAQAVAALLSVTTPQTSDVSTHAAYPAPNPDTAVRLEDLVVTGRSLDAMIRNFVDEVAAPNPNRGLARWEGSVCVGTANLRADTAQPIIDRVSTIADGLGLRAGAPGCIPNIMIVVTDQPSQLARQMVNRNRRAFIFGGPGMGQGGSALNRFIESDQAVRWWQISMPTHSVTGQRAVRIPGDGNDSGGRGNVLNYAPNIAMPASRLTTLVHDNMFRTIVLVDIDKVADFTTDQLSDYIAMVTFAQINPQADTGRYASVLNIFDDPAGSTGLTEWDSAYLEGLYRAHRTQKNLRANHSEIISSIHRTHQRLSGPQQD